MKYIRATAIITLLGLFCIFGLGNQLTGSLTREEKEFALFEKLELFSTVLALIQNVYVDEVSSKDLIYGALSGTLKSLDPYSQFLPPNSYQEMQEDTGGFFGGLGLEISVRDKTIVIVAPIPDSPASNAGLQSGDKIIRVDGESLESPSLNEVVKKFRGPVGSSIELTIFRPVTKSYFNVTLTRENIKQTSVVDVLVLPGTEIGYLRITRFQDQTGSDFLNAVLALEAKQVKGLILDLRNNPGGLLEEAIKVAGHIVGPEKLVVYTQGRLPEQNIKKISLKESHEIHYPLVVLINEGSASGSEVVAGAVQDWKKGILLGDKSFGKGSVQSLIPLKDGSALQITTARYYTPKGRLIHGLGIEPEVSVPMTLDDWVQLRQKKKDLQLSGSAEGPVIIIDKQIENALNVIRGLKVYLEPPKTSDVPAEK